MPGIDIDVVSDGRDDTGSDGTDGLGNGQSPRTYLSMLRGARLNLPNAIVAQSVSHMVREILARMRRAGAQHIGLLRIYCHGRSGEAWIGSGRAEPTDEQTLGVDQRGLTFNGADLEYLRGRFGAGDGHVTIHGCNFAAGKRGNTALNSLSSIWSVRVSASSAPQGAQQSGGQFVMQLQRPILSAANISHNPTPVTPLANPWAQPPETPIAAQWR